MILIVMHHYALHGGLLDASNIYINKTIGSIVFLGGKIGVNIFVLITGYFLIESKFKIKKVLMLITQVLIYTIIFFFIYSIFKGIPDFEILKKSFFPITFGTYWFITAYIGLYILSPFINYFIKCVEKNKFSILIGILIYLFSIIGFISPASRYMGNLQWFILLYLIGAYIKLYQSQKLCKKKIVTLCVAGYALLIIIAIATRFLEQYNEMFFTLFKKIVSMNSILILLESILIFLVFINMKMSNNNVINILGKSSIGVYLLHENIFSDIMWKKIFMVEYFYSINPFLLIFHIITSVTVIYLIGTIIELVRINYFEKVIFKNIINEKWFNKIDNAMNS